MIFMDFPHLPCPAGPGWVPSHPIATSQQQRHHQAPRRDTCAAQRAAGGEGVGQGVVGEDLNGRDRWTLKSGWKNRRFAGISQGFVGFPRI